MLYDTDVFVGGEVVWESNYKINDITTSLIIFNNDSVRLKYNVVVYDYEVECYALHSSHAEFGDALEEVTKYE